MHTVLLLAQIWYFNQLNRLNGKYVDPDQLAAEEAWFHKLQWIGRLMENTVDPDQLAKASWSEYTLFSLG